MGGPRGRGCRSRGAGALRGARDICARGLRGLGRVLEAASPRRAGVGRPTSRVFGVRGGSEDEELRELVRATLQAQAPRAAGAAPVTGKAGASAPPAVRRGAAPLERIDEDAAAVVVHPAS